MGKTNSDLDFIIVQSKNKKAERKGSHDILINQIQLYIKAGVGIILLPPANFTAYNK